MIWDYMFTYGGPELFMLFVVFVVTPPIYSRWLRARARSTRVFWIAGLWTASFSAAYADVFLIAREAKRMCEEEAGLHVYAKVPPDGIHGLRDIKRWAKLGISYVEHSSPARIRHYREEIVAGDVVITQVPELRSPYSYAWEHRALPLPVTRDAQKLIDRNRGTVIAEIVGFAIYPGFLDRHVLGLLGLTWTPPRCDGKGRPARMKRTHYTADLIDAAFG